METMKQAKKIFTNDVIAGAVKKHMPVGSGVAQSLSDPQVTAKTFAVDSVQAKAATLRSTVFMGLAVCVPESFPDRVKEMLRAPMRR